MEKLFQNILHLSTDNKLTQFFFKLLHRISHQKEALEVQNIRKRTDCFYFLCISPDSLEHAFLERRAGPQASFKEFLHGSIMSIELTLHHLKYSYYLRTMIFPQMLLLEFNLCKLNEAQQYYYSCRILDKTSNFLELRSALSLQWKAEKCES